MRRPEWEWTYVYNREFEREKRGEDLNRRARKREARRQEMLEVAMGIVERDGLEGLTIARLANALDAAVGALYRYFPGKDALLFSMQQIALEEFHQILQSILSRMKLQLQEDGVDGDPTFTALVELLCLMQAYIEDAWKASARHRLIFEFMSSYDPALSDEDALQGEGAVSRILELVTQSLSSILPQGSTEEELAQATLVVWAVVHGLDHFRKRDRLLPEHLHVTSLLPIAQENMLKGWNVAPELIQKAMAWFNTHQETLLKLELSPVNPALQEGLESSSSSELQQR